MKMFRILALLAALVPASVQAQSTAAPAASAANPAPAAAMTRAEFVAMVSDYFQWVHWSEYNDYAKPVPRQFSDVRTGDKFGKQIECALEESIVVPDTDNKFNPNKPMTHQDAAAILTSAFKLAQAPAIPGRPADTLTRTAATAILNSITS
ncbi:MAG: S-layer homology domain-containing protein, partial [Acidobacteria bacterium]|nr:S-layer homology domain-containing protein [Acidobacteriota bacterium]